MKKQDFVGKLMAWYRKNGRHTLPWRHTHDPYHILVSEIMLQQTQVGRVVPKYHTFIKQFPTLKKLARASGASVLRAWQGMGFNRRALFLKKCAEACVKEHYGKIPDTYESLHKLSGIGDYTARAVLSFAFKKHVALQDTNIRRIFSRVYFGKNPSAVAEERISSLISRDLPHHDTALYHGALMDFGSIVCRPKPLCSVCPMQKFCKAAPKVLAQGWQVLEGRVVRHPQSKFEGSDRKIRGRIVDLLREKERTDINMLISGIQEPKTRVKKILRTLLRDGLITKKGSFYQLPA
ncbi:MAG: A/G-specific adenine glycosylase [bacterium]|nr:A/G-specific adenine glycosylase [bacterium]